MHISITNETCLDENNKPLFEEAHPELHGDSGESQKKTPLNLLLNNKKVLTKIKKLFLSILIKFLLKEPWASAIIRGRRESIS
jgi:hypothetical protein